MKGLLSIFFVCIILIIGCRRLEDKPSWDVDVYTPLLKTDLDIYDILIDSLMEEQSDNSIDLVYKNKLFYYTIDSFLQIPDKVIEKVIRIDNLVIDDKTIEYPMTLGQIARAEGGLIGTLILANHGNSMQIPPLNGLSTDPFDVDATGFFQQATIDTGKIDVTIHNGLPVDADSIMYYFKNKNLGQLILRDTFIHIPAGMTQTHTFTMTNIVLEGLLKAELENFKTNGSGTASVPIDTNNAIVLTIKVYDLDLIDATAYFPSQNLINDTLPSVLEGLDALLTESTVKTGHLSVEMISTVP
ncbi:MAG TPA: hypothetical protein EYQ86_03155, partial [Bacteroidetes bacterium]|nr:hypothetical protein [Bacteroidota bacterium]